ncbi:hypothetical protein C2S52_008230 [Perilla frutescens var. hirtella]|nr:hypothetical protein C2S51_018061 [Perilla frutescens var. frutescens]KAH6783271.1 hypothetical protein C2S52_008230 [Perilla frutescens var. hirtella]
MEIPASLFLGVWANIGVVSLYLGFDALNKTSLPTSVSPAILFLFKHFLAISVSHSSTYTLVFRTALKIHVVHYYALFSFIVFPIAFASFAAEAFPSSIKLYCLVNAFVSLYYFLPWKKSVLGDEFFYKESIAFGLFPLLLLLGPSNSDAPFLFCMCLSICNILVIFQPNYAAIDLEQFCLHFHLMVMFTLLMFGHVTKEFSPILVLVLPFLTCVAHAAISGDERFKRWLPAATAAHDQDNRILSELKRIMEKNGNVIEFSIGMAGTILFQYFFRLTSFDHVVAFLYFAVAWLANLAVLLCRRDFGVFNFFLSNVIVGCTVSEFGVGRTTWLAYAAALLLYILRVKLELVCVVNRDNKEAVVAWRQINQTVERDQIA